MTCKIPLTSRSPGCLDGYALYSAPSSAREANKAGGNKRQRTDRLFISDNIRMDKSMSSIGEQFEPVWEITLY
jgi:hypothetical protein